KSAFLPRIHEPADQNKQEDRHFDQREQPELIERYRPWVQEYNLDVENHEGQRIQVVLDLELDPDIADRLQAAFVGVELDLRGAPRAEEIGTNQWENRK